MRIQIQRNNVGLELSAVKVRKFIREKYDCEIEINYKDGRRLVKIKGKKDKNGIRAKVKNKQQIIDDANALLGVKPKQLVGCFSCKTIYSCEENGDIKYCFECDAGCKMNGENGFMINEVVDYKGICIACQDEQYEEESNGR